MKKFCSRKYLYSNIHGEKYRPDPSYSAFGDLSAPAQESRQKKSTVFAIENFEFWTSAKIYNMPSFNNIYIYLIPEHDIKNREGTVLVVTIGLNGFSMVANYWSNDGMVTIHRNNSCSIKKLLLAGTGPPTFNKDC